MRYLKIASAKNPLTDFIELNDFNGFLCTQFQQLGISRQVEFLTIQNRNIPVNNKPVFKTYSLVIEILTPYSQYEDKYYELLLFLDRNKKDGIRLYHNPYGNSTEKERYCVCSIQNSSKTEKRQPIILNLSQNSLWLGKQETRHTSLQQEAEGNLFAFTQDTKIPPVIIDNKKVHYYRAGFFFDKNISYSSEQQKYYSVAFYNGIKQEAEITISGYNEVPLNIIIRGECINPAVFIYRKNDGTLIRELRVFAEVDDGYHIEINSNILENGVWLVDEATGERMDFTERVDYSLGSPYIYLDNGEYYIITTDINDNGCVTDVSWNEEYSE